MSINLKDSALIVQLNISQWAAKTRDNQATETVENKFHTERRKAGVFQKSLINKPDLKALSKASSDIRKYFYANTLPWSNNGERLLFIESLEEFKNEMNFLIDRYNKEVDRFKMNYSFYIDEAEIRLGKLFDESDYPKNLDSKFGVKLVYLPVPQFNGLSKVNENMAKFLREDLNTNINERLENAVSDIWSRIFYAVRHFNQRLKENKQFKNTLVENIANLIDILPKLNVTGDEDINKISEELKDLLIEPELLRTSQAKKMKAIKKSQEIISKFGLETKRTLIFN